jgi:hypothetical protein
MSPHPPQPAAQLANAKSPSANTSSKLNASAAAAAAGAVTPPAIYHNVQTYLKELEISEGQLSSCIK